MYYSRRSRQLILYFKPDSIGTEYSLQIADNHTMTLYHVQYCEVCTYLTIYLGKGMRVLVTKEVKG